MTRGRSRAIVLTGSRETNVLRATEYILVLAAPSVSWSVTDTKCLQTHAHAHMLPPRACASLFALCFQAACEYIADWRPQVMKKLIEKSDFVDVESKRLEKIANDKSVSPDKKETFKKRLNVLASFH